MRIEGIGVGDVGWEVRVPEIVNDLPVVSDVRVVLVAVGYDLSGAQVATLVRYVDKTVEDHTGPSSNCRKSSDDP